MTRRLALSLARRAARAAWQVLIGHHAAVSHDALADLAEADLSEAGCRLRRAARHARRDRERRERTASPPAA